MTTNELLRQIYSKKSGNENSKTRDSLPANMEAVLWSSLNENEKEVLRNQYNLSKLETKGWDLKDFDPYGPEYYRAFRKETEDFEVLITWAEERIKGKVSYSKRILKTYFNGYSRTQQSRILRMLLKQTNGDKAFAIDKLRECWDASLIPDVIAYWNETHDKRCSWLITQVFPKKFIIDHMEELSDPYNYYYICKRLGDEEWFVPDASKFGDGVTIARYLSAVANTRYRISEEEAELSLYTMISVYMYCHLANNERMLDGRITELPTGWEATFVNYFRISENTRVMPDFPEVLASLCRMGHVDIVMDFLKWKEEIFRHISLLKGTPDESTNFQRQEFSVILYLFPVKYKYLLDFSRFQNQTQVNKLWHILRSPVSRNSFPDKPYVDPYALLDRLTADSFYKDLSERWADQRQVYSTPVREKREEITRPVNKEEITRLAADNLDVICLVETFGLEIVDDKNQES